MSLAVTTCPCPIRVLHRQAVVPSRPRALRLIRPSLLDGRVVGDSWIVDQGADRLALCFDDWRWAAVRGVALDVPSLNALLHRLRHRQLRQRW